MPPKHFRSSNDEGREDDAKGSLNTPQKSKQPELTDPWGVPVKRIIQPNTFTASSNDTLMTKSKSPSDQEVSDHQHVSSLASAEPEYEEPDDYEEAEEQDEDESSERDWSGAEYEDKISDKSKVQTARASPIGRLRGSGYMRSNLPASSMYLRDSALATKKKPEQKKYPKKEDTK